MISRVQALKSVFMQALLAVPSKYLRTYRREARFPRATFSAHRVGSRVGSGSLPRRAFLPPDFFFFEMPASL